MPSKGLNLALQIIGYIFALGEAAAPVFAVRRIVAENTVRPRTPIPYGMILLNAVVLILQAARKQDPGPDRVAIAIYGTVVAIMAIYIGIYFWYSDGGYRFLAWLTVVFLIAFVGFLVISEFTLLRYDNKDKIDTLYKEMALVVTAVTYSISPGKEVWDAYRTHEVGGLDIILSLAFLFNAIVSTVSSFLPIDILPMITGWAGILCASGQIWLWLRCFYHGHHVPVNPVAWLLGVIGGE